MTTSVSVKDIRWDFLSKEGRAWLEKRSDGLLQGEPVKATPKRRVVRFEGVYIKEVHYRGLAALLKTLGGSTACKEGQVSRALAGRGVPAPRVLGYGKAVSGGLVRRDVLLTEEVDGGKNLADFLHEDFPRLPIPERHGFLRKFGSFVGKLHDSGALHADLHIGNILLQTVDGGRFVLLDTDRLLLKEPPLSSEERSRNLASILSNLRFHFSRNDYLRFLHAYGLPEGVEGRAFLARLEDKAIAHMNGICNRKARRSLSTNRRFRKEFRDGFSVYRKNDSETRSLVAALLPDPDQVLEKGEVLKAGRTVSAARVIIGGKSYFLKRYNCKGFIYRFRNAFRRSRAVRTWHVTWGFFARGVPVPEPIACIEERRWRLLGRSYLLTTFVEESKTLKDFMPRIDSWRRKEILAKLGVVLGRMHRYGCLHGDLKWNNILVCRSQRIVLVDLDGSRISHVYRIRAARRDLHRFRRDFSTMSLAVEDTDFFLACWHRWASISGSTIYGKK